MQKGLQPESPQNTEQSAPGVSGSFPEFESTPPWVPVWLPIQFLDRKKDDTYLVRVENVGGDGIGPGWIDKAYYADDERVWMGEDNRPVERGPWKITAFAPWPNLTDISVRHASDCGTSCTPAYPAGPCDCGAEVGSFAHSRSEPSS